MTHNRKHSIVPALFLFIGLRNLARQIKKGIATTKEVHEPVFKEDSVTLYTNSTKTDQERCLIGEDEGDY